MLVTKQVSQLSVCLPACLPACLPVCLSVCLLACLPAVCLSIHPPVCPPICPSVCLAVCYLHSCQPAHNRIWKQGETWTMHLVSAVKCIVPLPFLFTLNSPASVACTDRLEPLLQHDIKSCFTCWLALDGCMHACTKPCLCVSCAHKVCVLHTNWRSCYSLTWMQAVYHVLG